MSLRTLAVCMRRDFCRQFPHNVCDGSPARRAVGDSSGALAGLEYARRMRAPTPSRPSVRPPRPPQRGGVSDRARVSLLGVPSRPLPGPQQELVPRRRFPRQSSRLVIHRVKRATSQRLAPLCEVGQTSSLCFFFKWDPKP